MISLHNKLFFLGILVIYLSGCNQPIQLEKHSDAYLINSSEKPIHLWTYPGARNFSNVYTSYPLPNTPLLEVTINEPIEVEVINFVATINKDYLFRGDDTFEIFSNVCRETGRYRGYKNKDTCYFYTGSKYHFIKFSLDNTEYKGWIARNYLYKDLDGIISYSPDSQGVLINIEPPKYSVHSSIFSDSDGEYCTEIRAATLQSAIEKEYESVRRGEFETQDEFENRKQGIKDLATSDWKGRIHVSASEISTKYDIDKQEMNFNTVGIDLNNNEYVRECGTKYSLILQISLKKDINNAPFKDGKFVKPMPVKPAKLLSESLMEKNKRIIQYSGVTLSNITGVKDYYYRMQEGTKYEYISSGSERDFDGELKYMFLVNPLDNSLIASYFSQDYINNYLDNDIAVLSAMLNKEVKEKGDTEHFVNLLHEIINL
tara:strand:+ start:290 stop:1579 length:1290 start_codon:yes stop_codon:yes gene_type:complete